MPVLNTSKSVAYFRKRYVPFAEANLSIASSPVLYGLSVYTVINAIWDEDKKTINLFRLSDHYERLEASSKIMGFNNFAIEWPYRRFKSVLIELLKRNQVNESVLIRATFFIDELLAGTKINGLSTSLSVFIYPLKPLHPPGGIDVCVSSWQRLADNALPARAKVNGSYANASLMRNEALLNGYDDAIALDQNGHVAESTVANIFLIKNDTLITPSNSTDILEGITRDTVVQISEDLGLKTLERTVDRSELYLADEVFFCGSSVHITPVISIDRRLIGTGNTGRITTKLSKSYTDIQHGRINTHQNWITTLRV